MTRIIRLEPHSMAVFASIDVDPGFAMHLCSDASLFDTVHRAMFVFDSEPTTETRAEVIGMVETLRNAGAIEFEDGWIVLKRGMLEVTAFLMEKVAAAKAEERWADRQRYEEMKRREAAETAYAALRQALRDALGEKAAEIAARVA